MSANDSGTTSGAASALHAIRNALTPLTMHEDPSVAAQAWRIAELLPAIEADAASVAGLRARVADLEAQLAATDEAARSMRLEIAMLVKLNPDSLDRHADDVRRLGRAIADDNKARQ